jgi:hypothetical protein
MLELVELIFSVDGFWNNRRAVGEVNGVIHVVISYLFKSANKPALHHLLRARFQSED